MVLREIELNFERKSNEILKKLLGRFFFGSISASLLARMCPFYRLQGQWGVHAADESRESEDNASDI